MSESGGRLQRQGWLKRQWGEERECACVSVGIKLLASCLSASGAMAPASASLGPPCCFGATSHAMVVLERETTKQRREREREN